jgi:hypothetical protein
LLAQIVLLALYARAFLLLCIGLGFWLFETRSCHEAHGDGPGVDLVFAMQRQKQAGLQKTQPPLQIDAKGRGERIALPEGGRDALARFPQSRVVESDGHKLARTMGQSRGQQDIKQGLLVPISASMQFIVRTPVLLITAQTGQNARQRSGS